MLSITDELPKAELCRNWARPYFEFHLFVYSLRNVRAVALVLVITLPNDDANYKSYFIHHLIGAQYYSGYIKLELLNFPKLGSTLFCVHVYPQYQYPVDKIFKLNQNISIRN